ncbi:cytochrome c [Pedobacter borealis]|uniref:cytochrome c n=1 Tax=Pedobacter borealis TaxID=475254 RepID=UPI000493A13A|nr:cytochrome c [Pedobacter borealis]
MKKQNSIFLLAAITALLFACSKKQAEELKPETPPPTGPTTVTTANVTYTNFTGALFQTKCGGCHGANGGAKGFWLFNGISSAKEVRVNNAIFVTKTMPKGNNTISESDKALLKAWFDKGMPE